MAPSRPKRDRIQVAAVRTCEHARAAEICEDAGQPRGLVKVGTGVYHAACFDCEGCPLVAQASPLGAPLEQLQAWAGADVASWSAKFAQLVSVAWHLSNVGSFDASCLLQHVLLV